jgi:ATP-dependent RNA helicase RhlE
MSFDSLGLMAELLRAVAAQGYTVPTPIQAKAIPEILAGHDILAGAQTGTGKTAAFTLPMLQMLHGRQSHGRHPRALVLTPTRELAAQVEESVRTYGAHLPLRSAVIFGGVGMQPQVDRLRRGVDLVVATPGRLLDHVGQRTLDLGHIEILVLDEADRMLDMGFIHDIKRVLALLPKRRQNLLFSATYSEEIKRLADGLLNEPKLIEVARRSAAAELVSQVAHPVEQGRKRELLSHLIQEGGWDQVLVFTRTKHGANRLSEQLERDGISSAAIHGNKSQGARTRALSDFKAGSVRALVATDIAARGLDIDRLPHVVNFELPNVAEDYVHRIGRTGRAGSEGRALSLVSAEEHGLLLDIQRLLRKDIPMEPIPGFEPRPGQVAAIEPDRRRGPPPQRRSGAPRGRSGPPEGHRSGGRGR